MYRSFRADIHDLDRRPRKHAARRTRLSCSAELAQRQERALCSFVSMSMRNVRNNNKESIMKLHKLKSFISILLICVSTFGSATSAVAQRNQIRTDSRILYHNGPIMPGTPSVYLIFYGNWSGSTSPHIIGEFMSLFGGTPYLRINTTYTDANGGRPSGGLLFAGTVSDLYSHGPTLTAEDIQEVVIGKIQTNELPLDSNGIYLVIAPSDVTDIRPDGSTFCTPGTSPHHGVGIFSGTKLKYGFVGSPERCPSSAPQPPPTPNGDFVADGMINTIARLLNVIITSPLGTGGAGGGWYDRYRLENSDKCVGKFGTTFTTGNGARANISTGGRDYLIQQNWVNDRKGYCALSYQ